MGRARFEQRALEPVRSQKTASKKRKVHAEDASGDYKLVLDEMAAAMNAPAASSMDSSMDKGNE